MADDKKRRKGVPPVLSMQQVTTIGEEIYKKAGSQPIAHEDLAVILGNAKTSSSFIAKLTALKSYGIVARIDDDNSVLTEVATRLFSSNTEDAERAARLEIFRNPRPFALLHNTYAGQVLPEKKYVMNVLEKQGDISSDFYDEWIKRFESEGRDARIIYDDPRGRPAVRRAAGSMPTNETNLAGDSDREKLPLKEKPPPKEEEFKIPTPSGLIRVCIPEGCAVDDIEVARGLLDLIVKRMTKGRVD